MATFYNFIVAVTAWLASFALNFDLIALPAIEDHPIVQSPKLGFHISDNKQLNDFLHSILGPKAKTGPAPEKKPLNHDILYSKDKKYEEFLHSVFDKKDSGSSSDSSSDSSTDNKLN